MAWAPPLDPPLLCLSEYITRRSQAVPAEILGNKNQLTLTVWSAFPSSEYANLENVQFQKISILPLQKGLEFPGVWEALYGQKL